MEDTVVVGIVEVDTAEVEDTLDFHKDCHILDSHRDWEVEVEVAA